MNIYEHIINDIEAFEEVVNLSEDEVRAEEATIDDYPFRTTEYYASLIDKTDENDPIKRIQLPIVMETNDEGQEDTSNEFKFTVVTGLQHKYERTALILATNECAMYCRYCFRKRMVGKDKDEIFKDLDKIVDYISEHTEINNVLLSGGDPLMLDAHRIDELLSRLYAIKHIRFIRIGTRIPVVYPQRITEDQEMIDVLTKHAKEHDLRIVTQFNHPREISKQAKACIQLLREADIFIYNQSVLLKGINDDAKVLIELFNKLIQVKVQPYYIYQCRPVKGVKHSYQVPVVKGLEIIKEVRRNLNGITKTFRYIMSNYESKIEVLGHSEEHFYFKVNQHYNKEYTDRMFMIPYSDDFTWVDEQQVKTFL